MRNKIKKHYKSSFNSSPLTVGESEICFIIKHDCKCCRCDRSIFKMDDFPELIMADDELMCEECYGEIHREICPVCENSYDIYDGESEYEVINEEDANDNNQTPGIYHQNKLIVPIRINYLKRMDVGDGCCEVNSDKICPECVEQLVRKSGYMKSTGKPCILLKKFEKEMFGDYDPERLRVVRQRLIHQRITCRGIIESGNKI